LWSAQPGTGRITRYHPDGTVDRIVQLPARDVTALCFGGDDLRTLYVTSATQKLNDAELLAAPLSGSVFSIRCAFAGLPASRFGC
jgi:sugar lactone lactonase YvrE